jgi:uncharacterized protein YaeQ
MALTSTMFTFDVTLSDVDRGVYETIALRMAQHPSESEDYFVTRLLAYCLEYEEGIVFSRGISDADEPPIAVRDLTGTLTKWIEIGAPDAARLHKASKASPRLALYTAKSPEVLKRGYAGQRIHKAEAIVARGVPRETIEWVVDHLDRRLEIAMSVTDGTIYLTIGDDTHETTLPALQLFDS